MVVVADASVAIRGDLEGFHSDLRRAEGATAASASKMDLTFKNILKAGALFGIGTSLHQVVQGSIRELLGAADAFRELQQTQRTTDEVFGRSASVIEDWAKRSADAAGMSQRTVFQSASVMGQTLINMGFSAEEAAEKVVILQQRAAEMGAAFGQTPERAILAITAAMRGERDTIEKFGVSIKQADVNAKILALGLDTSTTAAKKNAEAIAILDLVLQQTSAQAGRFADSQDDAAIAMLVAQAKIEDGMLQAGQVVASIQLGAVKTAGFLGEQLDSFSLNFGDQVQTIIRLADEAGVEFDVMKDRIVNAMDLTGLSFPEVVATFEVEGIAISDQVEEEYMAAAQAAGAGVAAMADEVGRGGPVVAAEMGKIAGMLPSEITAWIDEIKAAGEDIMGPDGLAGGILAAQQKPLDAIDELNRVMELSLSAAEQIAKLTGEETVAALTAGLESPLLVDRLAANQAVATIIAQLNALGPAGEAAGRALMVALGLGIDQNAWTPTEAVRRAVGYIKANIPFSEPKDPKSPLRGITHWGGNLVKIITDGIEAELGTASAASRALAGALSPSVGVPAWNSAPGSPDALMAGGGGVVQYILNVEGLPVVIGSAEDVMARWKQLTSLSKDGVQ